MTDAPTLPRKFSDPWLLLATGFGSGFLPKAPGTWGSLVALPLWWLVPAALEVQLAVIALGFALGTYATHRACQRYAVGDAGELVADEIIGMWLVLLVVPAEPVWWLAAFVVFRLFDITKPFPIRQVERRVPGALGVMLDDVVAGVLAAIVLGVSVSVLQVSN